MRKVYLIRHSHPKQLGKEKRCISQTDLPLDDLGWYQAERLQSWAEKLPLQGIYASPLLRCRQTAEVMAQEKISVQIVQDLREMEVGAWEALTFTEIKARFPETYTARGTHPGTIPPTGGESVAQAGQRLLKCLMDLVASSTGDIAVIAHGGVNRGLLSALMQKNPDEAFTIPQPWGCINVLRYTEASQKLEVLSVGRKPDRYPIDAELEAIFAQVQTPSAIKAHGQAVAAVALRLAEQISETVEVDTALLKSACILHDLDRLSGSEHAKEGGAILRKAGYPDVAELIENHHDLAEDASIEAELLYLADKLVIGTNQVSLEERFQASYKKCKTQQAQEAWQKRRQNAFNIVERYQLQMGS